MQHTKYLYKSSDPILLTWQIVTIFFHLPWKHKQGINYLIEICVQALISLMPCHALWLYNVVGPTAEEVKPLVANSSVGIIVTYKIGAAVSCPNKVCK